MKFQFNHKSSRKYITYLYKKYVVLPKKILNKFLNLQTSYVKKTQKLTATKT